MRSPLSLLVGILPILFGLAIATIRHVELNVPLQPTSMPDEWQIELEIESKGKSGLNEIGIRLPTEDTFHEVLEQGFDAKGYSLATVRSDNTTIANLSKRNNSSGKRVFFYRLRVQPKRKTIQREKTTLPDQYSSLKSYKERLEFLENKDIDARYIFGLYLRDRDKVSSLKRFLEVSANDETYYFNPKTGRSITPNRVLHWGNLQKVIRSSTGLKDFKLSFISTEVRSGFRPKRKKVASGWYQIIDKFSLYHLSISLQVLFGVLLLLPTASLVIAFSRNILGLRTFGTFMPALIGLSLKQTGLEVGIVLLVLILALGLTVRTLLSRLQLLLVPRLAANLTIVVMVLLFIALIGASNDLSDASAVGVLPVVIITMIIERLSVSLEETGIISSAILLLNSTIAALIAYFVITFDQLSYLIVSFPELNFVVLGLAILLGRYSGYRLTELFRFRSFMTEA